MAIEEAIKQKHPISLSTTDAFNNYFNSTIIGKCVIVIVV